MPIQKDVMIVIKLAGLEYLISFGIPNKSKPQTVFTTMKSSCIIIILLDVFMLNFEGRKGNSVPVQRITQHMIKCHTHNT